MQDRLDLFIEKFLERVGDRNPLHTVLLQVQEDLANEETRQMDLEDKYWENSQPH